MDMDSYTRLVLALVLVLGLILLMAAALRRWGGRLGLTGAVGGRDRRLRVVEMAAVDARRRLILVRRDETEHLILIGGPNDLVVEQGIDASAIQGGDAGPTALPPPSGGGTGPGSFRSLLDRQGRTMKGHRVGDDRNP